MENFYKQIVKQLNAPRDFKRFILPHKGYTESFDRFHVIENRELHLPFTGCFLEYTDDYEGGPVKVALSVIQLPDQIGVQSFLKDSMYPWCKLPAIFIPRKNWFNSYYNKGYMFSVG